MPLRLGVAKWNPLPGGRTQAVRGPRAGGAYLAGSNVGWLKVCPPSAVS